MTKGYEWGNSLLSEEWCMSIEELKELSPNTNLL